MKVGEHMKALILAAGLGTRLAPITDTVPKCMVTVHGTPIIFQQINNLLENGITDITVVAGYKADVLKNAISSKWPTIHTIVSEDYAITNNMYSAYLGYKNVKSSAFLMMNADVFFDSSIISALVQHPASNAIVTDIGKYNEESMKVVESKGTLTKISKAISKEEALGASIDVYKFSAQAGQAFFDVCSQFIEQDKILNMWSEVALDRVMKQELFYACPLNGRWIEIDTHEDLQEAERIFSTQI